MDGRWVSGEAGRIVSFFRRKLCMPACYGFNSNGCFAKRKKEIHVEKWMGDLHIKLSHHINIACISISYPL